MEIQRHSMLKRGAWMKKINLPAKKIIGIKTRTTNQDNQAEKAITQLWGTFMLENLIEQIPNKIDSSIYCIYTHYESDFTGEYSVILGCEVSSVDELPKNMTSIEIPMQNYQVFESKGQIPQSIIKTWGEIWSTPLPRAYTADFEKYEPTDFLKKDAAVEIFIALKEQ